MNPGQYVAGKKLYQNYEESVVPRMETLSNSTALWQSFNTRPKSSTNTSQQQAQGFKNVLQLSSGHRHTCALTVTEVLCWGRYDLGQTQVPALKSPKQVSAGGEHTCALDDDGVKCWGSNESGQSSIPQLKNPKEVCGGSDYSCAIDSEGVKCWGKDYPSKFSISSLKNSSQISCKNRGGGCVLDDKGSASCWDSEGIVKTLPFLNPTQIDSSGFVSCALTQAGIECVGGRPNEFRPPAIENPLQVSISYLSVCAVGDGKVTCWGYNNSYRQSPPLENPTQVSIGLSHNCAVTDAGVVCWADPIDAYWGQQVNVPASLKRPSK